MMFSNTQIFSRNEHYQHILSLFPVDKKFSLLDIGCAIGSGCELLKGKFPGARITGVDISTTGIRLAKQKNKDIEYFVLDILKDPLHETYDWVIIIQTLEHFDNPFIVIDKCLRHVRNALIVSVPFRQKLMSSHKIMNRGWHRYVFNENTFKNYNSRVIKITEYIESTKATCILYEIKPG